MDANKNNANLVQNRPPKPDRRTAPQQGLSNLYMNWMSYQQRAGYPQLCSQVPQVSPHMPQMPQMPQASQMPQYFERPQNSFQQYNRPQFQQFPVAYQVPSQYQIPFQQVYRPQSQVGYPVQSQQ